MENKEKMTKQDILDNFTDELQLLEDLGFTDIDQNCDGLIKHDGILGFLKALYPEFDFDKFEKKYLNGLVIPLDAYVALLSANGNMFKAMEICAPFLHQNYLDIQDEGFTNENEILEALYYNTGYYNVSSDALKFLNRKKIYTKENEQIKTEFGLKDEEANFLKLFETNGNVIEAVLAIDPKKIFEPIVKKLDQLGLKYTHIENFENLVLNELKTIDNTVAYIKLLEKGKIDDEVIDEVMREYSYGEKLAMLEKYDWDPYKAIANKKYSSLYQKYKTKFSPMFIFYTCEGLDDLTERDFEESCAESIKTMKILKKYGLNIDDPFLNLKVLKFKEKPIAVMHGIDKEAANKYVVDILKTKGYSEKVIRESIEFQDFDEDLEKQEELIKIINLGHIKALDELREELGKDDFIREFSSLIMLLDENNYEPFGTLYDHKNYPFEYKEKVNSRETFDAFQKFINTYESIVSEGYPNHDLLFKNNLDAHLAVLENLFETCYNYTMEGQLFKKFKSDRLLSAAHEAKDDLSTFKKILTNK